MDLGFKVLTVRSGHTSQERLRAQRFDNPKDRSEIMVTSVNVSSASIDLQHGCSDVLFIDVPRSNATLLQAICRVYRLGQTRQAQAVVDSRRTYDQVIQARVAGKYVPQIAAMAGDKGVTVSEEEIDTWMADQPTTSLGTTETDPETARNDLRQMAKDIILFNKCADLHVRLNGLRSPVTIGSMQQTSTPRTVCHQSCIP